MFSYAWGNCLVVDLRLAFGWKGSPGFFYRWAKLLSEFITSQRPSDMTAERRQQLGDLIKQQRVEAAGVEPTRLPPDGTVSLDFSAEGDAPFYFAQAYLDDTICLDVNVDGRRQALGEIGLWGHYMMYGEPRPGLPPCVKPAKFTDFVSKGEVLGVEVDLNRMTVALPTEKKEERRRLLLEEWPRRRLRATARDVHKLIGKLRSWSYCVRHGRYFLRRLQDWLYGRHTRRDLDRPFPLTEPFHAELDVWRDMMADEELAESNFATPLFNHVPREPELVAISDACRTGGGGFVAPLGVWWQVHWPPLLQQRLDVTMAGEAPESTRLTIAHLELASLLLNLVVMAEEAKAQGWDLRGKAVRALADNTNAVAAVRRAGARDQRAAALMRLLGVLEIKERFSSLSRYLPGAENATADLISRGSLSEIREHMASFDGPLPYPPSPRWSQVSPPARWIERVVSVLSASLGGRR